MKIRAESALLDNQAIRDLKNKTLPDTIFENNCGAQELNYGLRLPGCVIAPDQGASNDNRCHENHGQVMKLLPAPLRGLPSSVGVRC